MFTGIVSAVGEVVEAGAGRLGIEHAETARHLKIGASVAVNGCCLTVVEKAGSAFFMDVVPETLRRTDLGSLKVGSRVNLELPLRASGLLTGTWSRVMSMRRPQLGGWPPRPPAAR